MEQAAQMFTDYYEGEVSVKPSDIRYKITEYRENQAETFRTLVPIQFNESPFPVIVVKKDGNIQDLTSSDDAPYPVSSITPLIDRGKIVSEETFKNEQQLANFGYLLVGYIDDDESLLGILPHPADN